MQSFYPDYCLLWCGKGKFLISFLCYYKLFAKENYSLKVRYYNLFNFLCLLEEGAWEHLAECATFDERIPLSSLLKMSFAGIRSGRCMNPFFMEW